ncbi:MAG: chemotaxis response regulator protein-glutamate methylesterase [Neptuniibacter caesariensis]|uniref:Protein-glutamate methylesterase/protein-glutamine glutaminase n=1 Tax=Neptuniibacter caesariensis TaxID=207954 RepID=A0A2G6JM96_NEPCE|nr:MAG: chemotaxis response regulator protein-glutamate methylesterase [Neptuniibacter caesariensis]
MPVKVLIVDDSAFFRKRISDLLSGDDRIEVVGSAFDGRDGVDKARLLKPDLITMDVEMPQMNGIEAVRLIMRECPTNILMLSSLTHEGAQVTLQALEAGALDYLSKDMRAWIEHSASLEKQLRDKVVAMGCSPHARLRSSFIPAPGKETGRGKSMVFRPDTARAEQKFRSSSASATIASPELPDAAFERKKPPVSSVRKGAAVKTRVTSGTEVKTSQVHNRGRKARVPSDCKVVVIGSSTGGPAALQQILTQLPANYPHPILLIQHMPKTFTSVFAVRLNQQCNIQVKEAEDGDRLEPGVALLSPGGHQMIIDPRTHDKVRVMPGDERLTYKPSVDVTFASVAKSFGKKVLAVVLTGMGADGCDGAKLLRQKGATVWAQNKESCTIYGMPQAIVNAGLANEVLDLSDFANALASG